jgi:hypothetical protein
LSNGSAREHAAMPDPLVIGGPLRLVSGLALLAIALAVAAIGLGWGWGIGWMAWVPAAVIALPASALCARRELRRVPEGIERIDGRLWRRGLVLAIAEAEVEVLPTAGLYAVVYHRAGREWPLAVWVTRSGAERVLAWLDAVHPEGRWPRREAREVARDR